MNLLNKHNFYFIILGIFVSSFIVPSYSFNTQCFIALVFVGIFMISSFKEKFNEFKLNYSKILIAAIPFLLALAGLAYTDNIENGVKTLVSQLPLFLLPMSVLILKLPKSTLNYCLKILTFSAVVYCLIVFGYVTYLNLNNLGNFFYYEQYGVFFGKHTTYTALFITLCITFLAYQIRFSQFTNHIYLFSITILFLLSQLYFLSVRIAIGALFINFIFILFTYKSKLKYIGIGLSVILCTSIFYLPNFKKRFMPSMTEVGEMEGLTFRKEHWLSVIETIKHNNFFFGNGTSSDRTYLFNQYKSRNLTSAYLEEYNAHNQFLEITLDYGFIGLILFIFLFVYLYYYLIKQRELLAILLLNVIIIFCITESLLVRQSGIMIFAILLTFIMNLIINNSRHLGKNKNI